MEKILILGGTKFVGRQLVEKLIEDKSYEIHIFNRGETNPKLFPNVKRIKGDRETEDINQIKSCRWDYVIDFSSFYPKSLIKTIKNLNKDLKKYIYISSISAYTLKDYDSTFEILEDYNLKTCSKDEATDNSLKTYGKRKAECENVLNEYDWLNKIILRPSIIYGKYDWSDRFYYWLYRVKNQHEMILPDSGLHKLSLTYAGDLVKIILGIIKSKIINKAYNCSTNSPLELDKIINLMGHELGIKIKSKKKYIQQDWLLENEVKPQSDIPFWFGGSLMLNNSRLKKDLNIQFTPFEKTIRDTIHFYAKTNWKEPNAGLNFKKEQVLIEKYKQSQ